MIRIINDLSDTPVHLRNSHYSRIILSHMQTYGAVYDFCEFYELKQKGKRTAIFCCFNGSLIGDIMDRAEISRAAVREVREFIRFKSPEYAELPVELAGKSGISGYQKIKRCFYEVPPTESSDGIELAADMERVFRTVYNDGQADYGLWLTDTVRRTNMDISRVYGYKSSVLTVKCRSSQMAYIADVATPEHDRRKGYAAKLLGGVAGIMKSEGYSSYLSAIDPSAGFYDRLGYAEIFTDYIYKIKESVFSDEH